MRQREGKGWQGGTWYVSQTGSYLAPEELSHSDKNTPEPLAQGEPRAAEGLPTKLHNDDLEHRRGQVTHRVAPRAHSHGMRRSPTATHPSPLPWDAVRNRDLSGLYSTPELCWLSSPGTSQHTPHLNIRVLHHPEAAGEE